MSTFRLVLASFYQEWALDDNRCITPNSAVGDCVPVKNCESILNVITAIHPLPTTTAQKINLYQCGYTKTSVKVCCPDDPNTLKYLFVDQLMSRANYDYDKSKMLPKDCGVIYDRYAIIQGVVTRVFQFPWMVLLSYKAGSIISFKCAGSIINEWYILTAAHCITNLEITYCEHDTSSNIDCNVVYGGKLDCAESVQDIEIEKVIPHPEYNSITLDNDIGLIRLATPLNTSIKSVKPICFPTSEQYVNLNLTGERVTVTGWGRTEKGGRSDVLLKADVSIISNEECNRIYNNLNRIISENQICAAGKNSEDSCEGDSGGPLQKISHYNNEIRYMQYGIVSYGPTKCGHKDVPGVYTRVDKYMDWILQNIH
ncbi:hypothetical protein FQR65_LT06392 [Abscondita terminalis]|nr:hypothetical protein FQR65_LT06392 [Abscondita terminalis]